MNKNIIAYVLNERTTNFENVKIEKELSNSIIFEATLQDFFVNRNKRRYPEEVLIEALQSNHIIELKKNKSWVGEAGHPFDKSIPRQLSIDHTRVSHIILETSVQSGKCVKGLIETSMFPMGIVMRDSIRQGMNVAFSMRGVASITQKTRDGYFEVKKPLKLVTYDWVFYPSHPNAYQEKIIKENTNLITSEEDFNIIPITEDGMLEYLNQNSENTNNILSSFNIKNKKSMIKVIKPEDIRLIIEDTDTSDKFNIKLEKYLTNTKYFKSLFNMR